MVWAFFQNLTVNFLELCFITLGTPFFKLLFFKREPN
jgi:hypothetical protein